MALAEEVDVLPSLLLEYDENGNGMSQGDSSAHTDKLLMPDWRYPDSLDRLQHYALLHDDDDTGKSPCDPTVHKHKPEPSFLKSLQRATAR